MASASALLELALWVFQDHCAFPRPCHVSGFERLAKRALPFTKPPAQIGQLHLR